jgi:hypothetical protein
MATPTAATPAPTAFHVQPEAVDLVLSGLVQHVLVALPANWVQAAGIRPNVADRWGPKRLWVGRLRHLRLLLRAEALRRSTLPPRVRDALTQQAQTLAMPQAGGNEERAEEEAQIVRPAVVQNTWSPFVKNFIS